MSDMDLLLYCEDCKQITPHIVSGSGKKKICQECENVPLNLMDYLRIFFHRMRIYVECENVVA